MKLDITNYHFEELIKKGYSIDMIVMLDWINRNLDVSEMCKNSVKIMAIHNTLKRKGLISDEGRISEIGISLLDFISKKTNKKLEKKIVPISDFDQWWEIFPSNDKFTIKGKTFGPTRSLRSKKEDCRLLFNKYILEKKYTKEEIINATLYDVNLKKERSYKENKNNLKYLQNSHTYLLQETFQGFIGMKPDNTIKLTTKLGSVDI